MSLIFKELEVLGTALKGDIKMLAAKILCIFFILLSISTKSSKQHSIPQPRSAQPSMTYDLIFKTEETTEETGAITMHCRNYATAENILVSEVQFWLNRTSPCDPGLRERGDFHVVDTDRYTISFNLSRHHEGDYTCGRRINVSHVQESPPKKLTSFQRSIPINTCIINQKYTAPSGGRVVLPCPFKPGALLQYYAVKWMKDGIDIAESPNSKYRIDGESPNSKYRIDGATYALIIDPVSVNDTSSSYQCQVSVTNPITDTKVPLKFYPQSTPDVSLSLTVVANNGGGQSPTATAATTHTIISNHYSNTTMLCTCSMQCNCD